MGHTIHTLKNGATLAAMPMDHMESVAIGIWLRTGGRYEDQTLNGISHLLEHLLFKGTEKRDMRAIKEAIEGRGGSFNGFTSEEFTCYLVKLLAKDAELGFDILSDMVLHPRLDTAEVEKEKQVIVEEINMYKDNPSQHVHELLAELMWPGQPLGMPLAGSVDSVNSLSRDTVASYKARHYTPANMVAVAAGRITGDDLARLGERYLGAAAAGAAPTCEKAVVDQKEPRLVLHTKDTEQTHLVLGMHTVDRFHPDRHIAGLLNIITGANMSSRLFHIVRDEMALCYEISSSARRYADCGSFTVSAGVDHRKLTRALEVIARELGRLGAEEVTAEELRRAKEYYRGQLLFALEDTMSHMLWLGEKVAAGEERFSVADILARVDRVTPADIRRVAAATFTDSNLNLAVISPLKDAGEVRDVLHI